MSKSDTIISHFWSIQFFPWYAKIFHIKWDIHSVYYWNIPNLLLKILITLFVSIVSIDMRHFPFQLVPKRITHFFDKYVGTRSTFYPCWVPFNSQKVLKSVHFDLKVIYFKGNFETLQSLPYILNMFLVLGPGELFFWFLFVVVQ